MVSKVRTLNFLPDIFRTPTNSQVLKATLDQLVQQPNLRRIQGYIGSKLGYDITSSDKYVIETTKTRQDYQLEPAVTFLKNNTSTPTDLLTYPGLLDGLRLEGSLTSNPQKLFESDIYSWDGFINLDMIINYGQYYWLPNGPDAVEVGTDLVFNSAEFTIFLQENSSAAANGYNFQGGGLNVTSTNPIITLLRGGTYTFTVNQTTKFWIQGQPGLTGLDPLVPTLDTRDVLGVFNNGASDGTVTFNVPLKNSQDTFIYPGNLPVDLVSTLPFSSVNNKRLSELGNIDGVTTGLNGLTVLFYNSVTNEIANLGNYEQSLWDQESSVTSNVSFDDDSNQYPVSGYFWEIKYMDDSADPVIQLVPKTAITNNTKITASQGSQFAGRNFVRDSYGIVTLIPYLSAMLDTLYYQDSAYPNAIGIIKLIDNNVNNSINIENDILGKKAYTSPNGVKFTNGLKVSFTGDVSPSSYVGQEYYVEGVGTAIELLPVSDFVVPEKFTRNLYNPYDVLPYDTDTFDDTLYVPVDQDYITIARNSIDKNAWSRSNRWFHIDVIKATATYNGTSLTIINDQTIRAKRPVIEFYPNLKMFDSGVRGKRPVDFIDTTTTNAFTFVTGQLSVPISGMSTASVNNSTTIPVDIDVDVFAPYIKAGMTLSAVGVSNTATVVSGNDSEIITAQPFTIPNPTTSIKSVTTNSAIVTVTSTISSDIQLNSVDGVSVGQLVRGVNVVGSCFVQSIDANTNTIQVYPIQSVDINDELTFVTSTNTFYLADITNVAVGQHVVGSNIVGDPVVLDIDVSANYVILSTNQTLADGDLVQFVSPVTISYSPDPNPTDVASPLYQLFDGARIIFANDSNPSVRNKVYVVHFINVTGSFYPVATLTEALTIASDGEVADLDQTVIVKGYESSGLTYMLSEGNWSVAQTKTRINQPPLFDVFDSNGISFGDSAYYRATTFSGTKLFSYGTGSGSPDPVLGIPLKYSSVVNIGDISFDVNFNSDTFQYINDFNSTTEKQASDGYIHQQSDTSVYNELNGWVKSFGPSVQYQLFNFDYDPIVSNSVSFTCDIAAYTTNIYEWASIKVFINDEFVKPTEYTSTIDANKTVITLNAIPLAQQRITIAILSNQVSSTGYFELPTNLEYNPFNANIISASVGDIRNQYRSIFNNANLTGQLFGTNNFRDAGQVIQYGDSIIQNSASLVLPSVFLRKQDHNLFNALSFNANEYEKTKNMITDLVNRTTYSVYDNPAQILDDVLQQISTVKDETNSFFWSDMVPTGSPSDENTYIFRNASDTSIYPLSKIYDFQSANYNSVLVYIVRPANGISTYIQLTKGIDYVVSSDQPYVTVTYDLQINDQVVVKEYNQTYGSYVPNTPTKLGLYSAFVPEVVFDSTYITPTYVLKGHDGSLTKLYGTYNNGQFTDLRDIVMFEFEQRIFNNLKVSNVAIDYTDILPGYFRTTDYSYEQLNSIHSVDFLNWVGKNRINYKSQYYDKFNQFTWNYRTASFKTNSTKIQQGFWRGMYRWLFDTDKPHTNPWEMLGLSNKPTWWDTHYGVAPYTSDNTLLWDDIRDGIVWNNGDPYTVENCVRPELYEYLPVDSYGKLVSPMNFVGQHNPLEFQSDWIVGDDAPAETAYMYSSTYPYDLVKLYALTKPAKFFNLGVDIDLYKYNSYFDQYLYNNRYHLNPSILQVYGDGTAKHSYINFVVDFEKQFGIDATNNITSLLQNLNVQLVYRMAGFSDKNLTKFFVDKASPNSKNNSLLIPDESHTFIMYDNQPFDRIVYSSIIVQKSKSGYSVYGNSQSKAYFTVLKSVQDGKYNIVTVGNDTIKLARNHSSNKIIVPYGTEFSTVSEVASFINDYMSYLESQGVKFDNIENGIEVNTSSIVSEMMYWSQSGWSVGSTINLNASAKVLTVDQPMGIIQPLTLQQQNFILNQNLLPIQNRDVSVVRDENVFQATAINEGDTLSYANLNVSNFEHVVVFDNKTVFNDVIYNLVTGLRQRRIILNGAKTADWNGLIDGQGFIVSQDNIVEWNSNVTYTKGSIVTYKNSYWVANDIIQPSNAFSEQTWTRTDFSKIQLGLLPNSSTRSYESTLYYDINRSNINESDNMLGYSLIGYRPRDYLASADLSDITQVNVYKNLLGGKGTANNANILRGATLPSGAIDYSIFENWAIKTNEYAGVLNQNFVEFILDESKLVGNPSIVGLTQNVESAGVEQNVPVYKLTNYGRPISSPSILPLVQNYQEELSSAGFVNFEDAKFYGYNYLGLRNFSTFDVTKLYRGDYIWLADDLGSWNIYTPVSLGTQLVGATNNLNGTVTLTFDQPHSLTKNQKIAIVSFNAVANGYYVVNNVVNTRSVTISLTLDPSILNIAGNGVVFTMESVKVDQPSDIANIPVVDEYQQFKVWVNQDTDYSWSVYSKTLNYATQQSITNETSGNLGSCVAYGTNLNYLVGDSENGNVYRYVYDSSLGYSLKQQLTFEPGFGSVISFKGSTVVITETNSNPADSKVYIFKLVTSKLVDDLVLVQTITREGGSTEWGSSLSISGDEQWLYVSAPDLNRVYVYNLDTATTSTSVAETYAAATAGSNTFLVTGNYTSVITQGSTISFGANPALYSVTYATYDNAVYASGTITASAATNTMTTTGNTSNLVANKPIRFTNTIGGVSTTTTYYVHTVLNSTSFTITDTVDGSILALTSGTDEMDVVSPEYDKTVYTIETPLVDDIAGGTPIYTVDYNYSLVTDYITSGSAILGERFGASISTNYDGSVVVIGSPNKYNTEYGITDAGQAYYFNRIVQNFQATYNSLPDIAQVFGLVSSLGTTPYVTVNGIQLVESTDFTISNDRVYNFTLTNAGSGYSVGSNIMLTGGSGTGATADIVSVDGSGSITSIALTESGVGYSVGDTLTVTSGSGTATILVDSVNSTLNIIKPVLAGDIITVNTALFVESQKLDTANPHLGGNFGISVDTNRNGNEIIAGAPFELTSNTNEGAVYRYTNAGKNFGMVTGTNPCSALGSTVSLLINGFHVDVTGSPANIVSTINAANITNITATLSVDNVITISLVNQNLGIAGNNLTVVGFSAGDLQLLGINPVILTQTIYDPHQETATRYGYTVKFNESNSFAVAAPTATRYEITTFDFTDNSNTNDDTLFDNGATVFVDTFPNAGEVYIYEFLNSVDPTINNPGAYAYAQSVNDLSSDYGSQPYYGTNIAFNDGVVVIGVPNSVTTTEGKVVVWANKTGHNNWSVFRRSGEIVDINKVNDVQLFKASNNDTLDYLDYIDPLQGKLLGAVRENIDYITSQDPAGYNTLTTDNNTGGITWGSAQVGQLWFDTNRVRFVNYHQTNIIYNSKYWGTVFPDSDVAVYTWVETYEQPAAYTGLGTVYSLSDYATEFVVDSSGALIPKFYYWVRNTTITSTNLGKTLNDTICEQYIRDPRGSGIGYMAPLSSSTFGLFNCYENIREENTVLHIGFSTGSNDDMSHTEFTLIRDGVPDDFLPGLPTTYNSFDGPQSLYRKLIDSMSGVDIFGNVVPDPTLPKLVQSGISVRPRQSFFADRYLALQNYLGYVNQVIVKFPISESRIPGFLKAAGEYYDTTKYWEYVNWWSPGYSNSTKSAIEVPKFYDLQTITPVQGLIAKVTSNSDGKRETYIYETNNWVRIGLEQGTIQFKSDLWDYEAAGFGFGNSFFDSTLYDSYPDVETRFIIRAINEEILINDLLIERNKALMLLFNFIESESRERQNYLPWLNKTSFIDVQHIVSKLQPYNRYQRDNQDLLAGYINEVKPYHVIIKDFEFKYSSEDFYQGDITDFDLPAQYDVNTGKFESPELIYSGVPESNQYLPESLIWQQGDYVSWFDNYGITGGVLEDYPICNLAKYITNNASVIYVNDIIAMPINGTIRIDDEIISYGDVDRYNNRLLNITRGVDNTIPTDHLPDAQIYITAGPVIMINSGRSYTNPPNVVAAIDTSVYPEPRIPASLIPIMADDRVIGIRVDNPGDGFAVTPEILIDPAITVAFNAADVSSSFDTIALINNQFQTGDLVKYHYGSTSKEIGGLINNGKYYVGVVNQASEYSKYVQTSVVNSNIIELDSVADLFIGYFVTGQGITDNPVIESIDEVNRTITISVPQTLTINEELVILSQQNKVIAFYTNYKNCINDINRLNLVVNGDEGEQYLDLGAFAYYITSSSPVRELKTVMKFDRTSYKPMLTQWASGTYYAGVLEDPFEESSSTYPASTDPAVIGAEFYMLASSSGILLDIVDVDTNVTPISVTVNYNYNLFVQADITDSIVLSVNNTFGMLPGLKVTGANIVGSPVITAVDYALNTITVDVPQTLVVDNEITVEKLHRVFPGQVDGQQVTLYNGTPTLTPGIQCYLKVTSDNTFDLYNNPLLTNPLTAQDFDIAKGDFVYLKEPWTFNRSLVMYDGKVFRCVISNNDTTFNYDNWEELSSDSKYLNALDRIVAYYKPTINMPGLDFTQLLQGVTYPNSTYYSNAFPDSVTNPTNQYPLDTELLPQAYSIRGLISTGIVSVDSKYYVVASNGEKTYLLSSQDGVVFSILEIAQENVGPTGLIYANGSYVMSTQTQLSTVIKSGDAQNWFAYTTPASFLNGVYYDSSIGLYLGYGNNIISSTDSNQNWTQVYNFGSSFSNQINQIIKLDAPVYSGYIAVGSGQNIVTINGVPVAQTVSRILLSNDGSSWNSLNFALTDTGLNAAAMDSTVGVLVVAGDNGVMFSTVNASVWIPIVSPTAENLVAGTFANGYYVFAGDNGTIVYSQYGVTGTWSTATVDTTVDIKAITFDGSRFVAVGTDDTILYSTDGTPAAWTSLLYVIDQPDTDYVIKGDPYTAGYGPEEMVPGVVSDTLNMVVTTRPGSTWTYETYDSSGYTVINFTDTVDANNQISFNEKTVSVASIDVFMQDNLTGDTIRLYESVGDVYYTIDWYNQIITIVSNTDLSSNLFSINVYEFGGGNQLARSNSEDNPIRNIDLTNNTCEIYLDINYQGASTLGYSLVDTGGNPWYAPTVLVNGVTLTYGENNDYFFSQRPGGLGKIIFNSVWNPATDYISFVVFGETPLSEQTSPTWQNGYSIPETEVFEYDGSTTSWTLSNYSGDDNETNAIVEINGVRLSAGDWAISSGILTVTATLSSGDFVACTTFNITAQQSLVTNAFTGVTVAPITNIDTDNPAVLTTSINHNLVNGDLIRISDVEGATGYNGQTFYVKKLSNTTVSLYVDSATTVPVNGAAYDTYLTGGFISKPSQFQLSNQWRQINTQRLWVTVNGYKIMNDALVVFDDFDLSLLREIVPTDEVIVTSMVTNETPNELSFTLSVNKDNIQSVYRTDLNAKTWLIEDLDSASPAIYLSDVSKIVQITNTTYKIDSSLTISLPDVDLGIMTSLKIVKNGQEINSDYYYLDRVDLVPTVVFVLGSTVEEGDFLDVEVAQGNVIIVEGEKIRFTSANITANTLTGLVRGVEGTTVSPMHPAFALVYGFIPANQMPQPYLGVTWNSNYYNPVYGDPLQLSVTPAALFLKSGSR